MSGPPVGKLIGSAGLTFALAMPLAAVLLAPPDEYVRTLFLLMSLFGAMICLDGKLIQKAQEQHLERKQGWTTIAARLLMALSPMLGTAAVLIWFLWRSEYCYHVALSGLSILVPAVGLKSFRPKSRKARARAA